MSSNECEFSVISLIANISGYLEDFQLDREVI